TGGGAAPARRGGGSRGVVGAGNRGGGAGALEQDPRRNEGHQQRDGGLRPRHAAAVFADDPGNGEQGEDAECRLEILHCPFFVKRGLDSASEVNPTCGVTLRKTLIPKSCCKAMKNAPRNTGGQRRRWMRGISVRFR